MSCKLSKYIALFIILSITIGGLNGCTVTNLSLIKYSNFKSLPGNIYVDPSLTEDEYRKVLFQVEKAKDRINKKYGTITVDPVVIIVGNKKNASKYGIEVFPGTAYITPWEIYLVLNQQKINDSNVIAHELMHGQVADLTGYWFFVTKLPTWLSEGIAMQVDYREQYIIDYETFDFSEVARIKKVESNSDFWTNSKEDDIRNYRAAKVAVHEIFAEVESRELYKKLEAFGNGSNFDELFIGSSAKSTHNKY